jgi:hypothetical protein
VRIYGWLNKGKYYVPFRVVVGTPPVPVCAMTLAVKRLRRRMVKARLAERVGEGAISNYLRDITGLAEV